MDIIKRNFFRLLRSGALNEFDMLEPMSGFKWKRLAQIVESQKVVAITLKGIKNHQFDENFRIPSDLIQHLEQIVTDEQQPADLAPQMANTILNNRLKRIRHNERHALDTSTETLRLLDIILCNTAQILNKGIPLSGIIELGRYLRTKGHKVDFVKLDAWIDRLHIRRMAQLQGSILMATLNFEANELPFVHHVERQAYALALRTLTHTQIDATEEWNFRTGKTGFIHNNNKMLRRNLRRSIRYINYAPIETTSNFFANLARSLSEIEE